GALRELEQRLAAQEERLRALGEGRLLKEEVDSEDIAEVVSRWTGIPVTRLLEGEMQKLLRLEDRLHERVVDQRDAVAAVADEIEKAHQDVFNILLQILEDGRLTDGHGRTVDFRNSIIIMTSNLGSQYLRNLDPDDLPAFELVRVQILEELRRTLRPEFLNRI